MASKREHSHAGPQEVDDEARPSTTATWVACARGALSYDKRAVAQDLIAEKLVPAPYDSILRLTRRSRGVARRAMLTFARVASLGSADHLSLRTRVIDDEVARFAARGTQMVILGAGLDSRAYRLESLRSTTVFEVDHPKVQTYKRARVAALTQVAKAVRFVGVDFEHDDLASALTAAGHDPSAPTFFLWEGVAMYLTRAAIDATLATLASRASQGSTLVLSYWVPPDDSVRGRALMLLVKSGREPIRTLVSPDELARIVAAHGFDVIRDGGTADWGSHYLGRSVSGPPERLAVAEREDRTALRKPNL